MAERRRASKGDESDDQLRAFLVELATDPAALGRFVKDPETSMSEGGLSSEDQAVLRSGNPAAINARLASGPGAAGGGPMMLVVDVAGDQVNVRPLIQFPQLVQQIAPQVLPQIQPQVVVFPQVHPQILPLQQVHPLLQQVLPLQIQPLQQVQPLLLQQIHPLQFQPLQIQPLQQLQPQLVFPQIQPLQLTQQLVFPQVQPLVAPGPFGT